MCSADSYSINHTGKSNLLRNDNGIKYQRVKRRQQKKLKIKVSTCILVVALLASSVQHSIKIKCYSSIKCSSQSQQRNLCNLQKKEDRFNKVYDID